MDSSVWNSPRLNVNPEGYCVLCQYADIVSTGEECFPYEHKDKSFYWEPQIIGFFNWCQILDSEPKIHCFIPDIRQSSLLPHFVLKHKEDARKVLLILQADNCMTDSASDGRCPIFFAHVRCWKVLRQRYHISPCEVYKLARNLRPLFLTDSNTRLVTTPEDELNLLFTEKETTLSCLLPKAKTGLGDLLFRIAYLPNELKRMIVSHVPPSNPVIALIHACHSVDLFEKAISEPTAKVVRLVQDKEARWLLASTTTMFGEEYIHRLVFSNTGNGCQNLGIQVNLQYIRGVKYLLGIYGVRAICLIYEDKSCSPWLGDSSHRPNTAYYGIDRGHFSELDVLHDGLRILRIGFRLREEDRRVLARESNILWNCDPREIDHRNVWEGYGRGPSGILNYPDCYFRQYLPLQRDGCYASGITLSMEESGIYGISAHSDQICNVGQRWWGDPISFFFDEGEYLTFIATYSSSWPAPFLFLMTNRGRSAFIGPYGLKCRQPPYDNFRWKIIASGQAPIIGMVGVHGVNVENNFAEPTNSTTSPIVLQMPSFGVDIPSHLCLTICSLSNIKIMQVRREGNGCSGLFIEHLDGSKESLGRWDPNEDNKIYDFYHHSDGPLTALTFQFGGPSKSRIVDIIVGDIPTEDPPSFVWRAVDQFKIAWFLGWDRENHCHTDLVMYWDGVTQPWLLGRLGEDVGTASKWQDANTRISLRNTNTILEEANGR